MGNYINPPIGPTDPEALSEAALAYLIANIPNYRPNDNNVATWLIMALADMVATAADVGQTVPTAIFRYFGESVVGLQPIDATFATAQTTWVMVDDAGYTIPAGTNAGYTVTGDTTIGFVTVDEVVVAPGDTTTMSGAVNIQAVDSGSAANGIGPSGLVLLDALSFVDAVSAVSATTGGQDAETDQQYIGRLVDEFRLFTPTPILGSDFATMARNVTGVYRATGVDNYNPADHTTTNERMVAVACVDQTGAAVSTGVKTAVTTYLESLREINFILNVFDPAYTTVDVAFTFTTQTTADPLAVKALAEAAVNLYLQPATWGIDDGDATGQSWTNDNTVRYNELIALINNVDGVRFVTALTINTHAVDLVMSGQVAMPEPGAIVGTPA